MPYYVTAKHIWLILTHMMAKMALTDSDVEDSSEDSSPDKILISWLVEARPLMTSSSRPLASAESWVLILVVQSSVASRISAARTWASFCIRSRSSWEYCVTPFEIIWKNCHWLDSEFIPRHIWLVAIINFRKKIRISRKVDSVVQKSSFLVKLDVFNEKIVLFCLNWTIFDQKVRFLLHDRFLNGKWF